MLLPGDAIGILGGGQLGRMLALAAAPLGLEVVVYSEEPDCPAFAVTPHHLVAPLDDDSALRAFAQKVKVITYETENIPAHAAELLETITPVRPSPRALGIIQDRLTEKAFVADLGIPTAQFAGFSDDAELVARARDVGYPLVMKTRRLGYDGKGQVKVQAVDQVVAAWDALGRAPSIIEAWIPFAAEVSIVAVRGIDGSFSAYDLVENLHRDHILSTSTVPAAVAAAIAADAEVAARRIAAALNYVGVFAVEYFVTREGTLLVNEIAPRVHNSGHWTLDACLTSQFEAHLRAIAGWPIGSTARFSDAVMTNLIGDDVDNWRTLLAESNARLHLYGKREARPGRKMGHVTRLLRR